MDASPLDLGKFRVVLVEPLYGGNIGQVARAMVNFGLSSLVLVNPREHLTPEAYWMAREGKGILEGAAVHPTLEEALAGTGLAVGTTRRAGKYRRPALTPEEFAAEAGPLSSGNEIAIVFGREDSGLSGAELALCQWIVTIPASDNFPSLNLAQAVLLIGYELFLKSSAGAEAVGAASDLRLAGPAALERFYRHLEETLTAIGFLTGDQAPAILISLRRVFGRANLEERDVKILRGILGQMEWYKRNATGPVLKSEKRAAEEASVGDAAVGEGAVGGAAVGEGAVVEAAVGEAAVGKTVVGEGAIGEAAVGKAVVGEATVGEAAVGEAAVAEAAVGDAVVGEGAIGESAVGGAATAAVDPRSRTAE